MLRVDRRLLQNIDWQLLAAAFFIMALGIGCLVGLGLASGRAGHATDEKESETNRKSQQGPPAGYVTPQKGLGTFKLCKQLLSKRRHSTKKRVLGS